MCLQLTVLILYWCCICHLWCTSTKSNRIHPVASIHVGGEWFANVQQYFMVSFSLLIWSINSTFHYGNDLCHVLQMCLSLQDSDVFYIPTSGLSGENLTTKSKVADLTAWYTGPCLLEQIGVCPFSFFVCVLNRIQAKTSCTYICTRGITIRVFVLNRSVCNAYLTESLIPNGSIRIRVSLYP